MFEDDKEQVIDRVIYGSEPINAALMMDTSGSTRFKMEEIQHAALTFLGALGPDDTLMVASFNNRIYLDSDWSADRNHLRQSILQTRTSGETRLFDALHIVLDEFLDRVPGRKAIVILTDGVDTESRFIDASGALSRVEQSNAAVYAVQYTTETRAKAMPREYRMIIGKQADDTAAYREGVQFLQRLSNGSGGRLLHADTVPNLNEAFGEIAQELRRQYTICYYPGEPRVDGSYHQIRVTVDRQDLTIRARLGYRAIVVR